MIRSKVYECSSDELMLTLAEMLMQESEFEQDVIYWSPISDEVIAAPVSGADSSSRTVSLSFCDENGIIPTGEDIFPRDYIVWEDGRIARCGQVYMLTLCAVWNDGVTRKTYRADIGDGETAWSTFCSGLSSQYDINIFAGVRLLTGERIEDNSGSGLHGKADKLQAGEYTEGNLAVITRDGGYGDAGFGIEIKQDGTMRLTYSE